MHVKERPKQRHIWFFVFLSCLLMSQNAWADEVIWIEGEDATSHTFNKHGWYSNTDIDKSLLSPGKPGGATGSWLAHFDNNGKTASATYSFTAKESGTYVLWVRCNPFRATLSVKLDGGKAEAIDLKGSARSNTNLITPKIDIRFISWVKGVPLQLTPGKHTITFDLAGDPGSADKQVHSGIDVVVLAKGRWAPTGTLKPAELPKPGPPTWFVLQPDDDTFDPRSIIDVSHLLHKPAGKFGFISRKGASFMRADGKPIKFWGVGAGMAATTKMQEQQARLYAKYGINIVRQHPVQAVIGLLVKDGSGKRVFNKDRLDRWDRWFATLKKHGIYMTWSLFYPHVITPDDGYPADLYNELPKSGSGKSTSGIVNFMTELQDAQWNWLKALLEHKNPYTGLRYIDDPALAMVEVHNEDCLFWHAPLNDLVTGQKFPKHTAILKQRWADWLKAKYKDDTALKKAWGAGVRSGDSVNNANMKIYAAWEMSAKGPSQNAKETARMGDFIRFLAETQRAFYERRIKRLRDLGYKGVTISTAWKAGGPAADPANIWADDSADAIDRHNYFGGGVGGHSIRVGDVSNDTHLSQAGRGILSTGLYQVEDKPFVMTEWTQKPPNQWKAEIAPLMAFYGMGLQGWDASFHFAGSRPRIGGGWPGNGSYVTETPHYLGQFPALAFAIYKGHFKEGTIAAARRVKTSQIFLGIDALNQDLTGGGYDEKEPKGNLATPTEVLAIGRVTVKIDDTNKRSEKIDWSAHWDQSNKLVKSITGELTWDVKRQVVLVHSQKTQGVIGFAGGQTIELPGVDIEVKTKFVSLLLTPLDDKPLLQSSHILVTAMAQDKQWGAIYNQDGTKLLTLGGTPLLMEPVQATLSFKGESIISAKVVDVYGVPTEQSIERNGNTVTIDGRYQTFYYEIKRAAPPAAEVSIEPLPTEPSTEPSTDDAGPRDQSTSLPDSPKTQDTSTPARPDSVSGQDTSGLVDRVEIVNPSCGCQQTPSSFSFFLLLCMLIVLRRPPRRS